MSNWKVLFFKKPLKSDWAFWLFTILFLLFSYSSYLDFYSGTRINSLNSFGLIAALIDLVILPGIISFLICVIVIFIPRNLMYFLKDKNFKLNKNRINFIFAAILITFIVFQLNGILKFPNLLNNLNNATQSAAINGEVQKGTLKKKPTEPTVTPSDGASETNLATPTKTISPSPTQSPAPEPTNSWWPEYFSPWGSTIAYKYNHYFSNGCTVPDQFGCWGGHSIEVRVTEPCSSMSAEFTDESGVITIGYFSSYVSTGQSFNFGTPDATPTTPGRVTNIICTP